MVNKPWSWSWLFLGWAYGTRTLECFGWLAKMSCVQNSILDLIILMSCSTELCLLYVFSLRCTFHCAVQKKAVTWFTVWKISARESSVIPAAAASRTGSFHVKGKKSLKYVRLKEARKTHEESIRVPHSPPQCHVWIIKGSWWLIRP